MTSNVDKKEIKYEVLKLRKGSKEHVFFIKKEYWKNFEDKNGERAVSKAGLNIYYKRYCQITNGYITKISELEQVTWSTPWGILWSNSDLSEVSRVKYAYVAYQYPYTLQVDKEYRKIGLGGYSLDSLTQWAQKNFNELTVSISISGSEDMGIPSIERKRFYSKRNIKDGAKVSELKTCFDESRKDGRAEVIKTIDDLYELMKDDLRLRDCQIELANSKQARDDQLYLLLKRSVYYKQLAVALPLCALAVGLFLGVKFS